jgi:hypothetical protein
MWATASESMSNISRWCCVNLAMRSFGCRVMPPAVEETYGRVQHTVPPAGAQECRVIQQAGRGPASTGEGRVSAIALRRDWTGAGRDARYRRARTCDAIHMMRVTHVGIRIIWLYGHTHRYTIRPCTPYSSMYG